MYLISAYFDESADRKLRRYMEQIAGKTGNVFMTENHVPPHMTLSSLEARNTDELLLHLRSMEGILKRGKLCFVSVGTFFPYVIYAAPVFNQYLHDLSMLLNEAVECVEGVSVNKYYRPMQWMPHVTLGKQLTVEQMRMAFEALQNGFAPLEGEVTAIALSKTNPHEDLYVMEL